MPRVPEDKTQALADCFSIKITVKVPLMLF